MEGFASSHTYYHRQESTSDSLGLCAVMTMASTKLSNFQSFISLSPTKTGSIIYIPPLGSSPNVYTCVVQAHRLPWGGEMDWGLAVFQKTQSQISDEEVGRGMGTI